MRTPSRLMPKFQPRRMSLFGWVVAGCVLVGAVYFIYEYPLATISLAAIVAVTSVLMNRSSKQRLEALAVGREDGSICTFARRFDATQIDTWVIRAVYEQLQDYLASLYPRFPIRPEDRLYGELISDPDDLDLDLVVEIANRTGRSLKKFNQNPYHGKVTTVEDLVLFFNSQPKVQLNHPLEPTLRAAADR